MKKIMKRALCAAALLGVAGAMPAAAGYPDKPITFVVPYPPGGSTDNLSRTLVPLISRYLGADAKIVVSNQPGATGAIGMSAIAHAKPDGYTFGLITTPPAISVPIERKTNWNWTSYDLLANVVEDPVGFAVLRDGPMNSLADLIEQGKKKKGITVGTTGVGSDDHFLLLMFQRQTGVPVVHVPFKGTSEIITALRGNVIDVAAINVSEIAAFINGGSPIVGLAQAADTRGTLGPDVPTFKEQGIDLNLSATRSLAAPKGLPDEVREKLVRAVAQAVDSPEFREQAKTKLLQPVNYLSPQDYAQRLEALDKEFKALWSERPWSEN
ncbi:tripartite tricarboxylate transporter substrate binding protein [Bordetella petrii]|nr:tripartite tricarboxylate transporter substrate binding protein [Bordetella petrii]